VLFSLSLILMFSACSSNPVVLVDPEIVEVEKLVRVRVPAALLIPCAVTALPVQGDTWDDVFQIMKAKDLEQRACNERFVMIRDWQEGER